jgi:hypothetical protein
MLLVNPKLPRKTSNKKSSIMKLQLLQNLGGGILTKDRETYPYASLGENPGVERGIEVKGDY